MILEKGEIGIVNLKVRCKLNKTYFINDVIFSIPYEGKRTKLFMSDSIDKRIISKIKKNEDLIILEIEVIKKVGFKNKTNNFTSAIVHKEERNKITGAYE
jgi:putative cell wall-binding protein